MAVEGNPLIVALDVAGLEQATQLARRLEGEVAAVKVGHRLVAGHGPDAVRIVGRHAPVFLDLKLHDIPSVVGEAVRAYARLGIAMLTVHASGGPAMVEAAVRGMAEGTRGSGRPEPMVLAVTVLTSLDDADLARMRIPSAAEQAPRLAALAIAAGAHGVVCAPRDLPEVRPVVGDDAVVVTPGIRPVQGGDDDHARATGPEEAAAAGADYLVVGRPVTSAADPVTAARSIAAAAAAARRGAPR